MQRLHFRYEMRIEYSVPVSSCHFTIKCIPKDTKRQIIANTKISLSQDAKYQLGVDGFRNAQLYGTDDIPHDLFVFSIEGDATTGLSDYEEEVDEDIAMIFRHPHGLNISGEGIREFYNTLGYPKDGDVYGYACEVMHSLHDYMNYEPNSTDKNTTAEEAFNQKKGVCQDYAHIFISLMHLAGISARYVTGLIIGEGASHAWVEILNNGKWYGIDPTNDTIVADEHIKIGVGRDANDCQINRGIMHGGGLHIQTVSVNVSKEIGI